MRPDHRDRRSGGPDSTSARTKLLVSFGAGMLASAVAGLLGAGRAAPLIGWDVLALVFGIWIWLTIWPLDAGSTASYAKQEDPSFDLTALLLLGAAMASLMAVGVVLIGAGQTSGYMRYLQAALALASVFVSWSLVHTVFTLRYARMYYSGDVGGVDFNAPDSPDYADFAYLSFTIGMTFQVSDTDIESKPIRRAALRHAWLSYPLGAVIIAASINLVTALVK